MHRLPKLTLTLAILLLLTVAPAAWADGDQGDQGQATAPEKTAASVAEGALREPERRYLLRVLRACEWNKKEAARRLHISRSTLYRKIQEHGLSGVAAG